MDDITLYKRDEKAKKIAKDLKTKISKLRFKDQDIDIKKTIKIGRDDVNEIVIKDDPLVSRKHAIIEQKDGKFYLTDKDSTNGTYINKNPVAKGEKILLNAGDEIMVGKTILTIV